MGKDLIVQAMRSVFSVRVAFSEQAVNGGLQEVETSTGKMYVGGDWGSAFCFHEDGLLLTCEHVRRGTHKWSNLERGVRTPHSKRPSFVVVCPYEGGDAVLDWRNSWRAEFVAHTGHWDPTENSHPEEPPLPPGMILLDPTDLAILRLVEPVVGTPLVKPPPLRFSRNGPAAMQECWVLGYPPSGGTTPTLVPVTFSFADYDAASSRTR